MTKSDYEKVIKAVEDRFYEKEMFSGAKDISNWTEISENKVRDILDDLSGNELFKVYEGKGKSTIYITKQMRNSLFSKVKEPDWIKKYEFEEKKKIKNKIGDWQDKLSDFVTLEKLLYAGGPALEPPVEEALEVLGFNPNSSEEDEDFVVEHEGEIFVIEVKGKTKKINKSDVAQLGTWLDKWVEKESAENLTGFLLVNHFRKTPISERNNPLTEKAEEFLKLRKSAFFKTTHYLFKLVKKVIENEIKEEKAKKKLLEQKNLEEI